MLQKVHTMSDDYSILDKWISGNVIRCAMLVCGNSIKRQKINSYFEKIVEKKKVRIIRFSEFTPNPKYEEVLKGVKRFREEKCDSIIAVGGGSAMDVAKCIRLFSGMTGNGENGSFLERGDEAVDIPFLAVPTTAGTGSEATSFAVIYHKGKKISISEKYNMPDTVVLNGNMLKTLPDYQRKSTMMDALCHAIESFWSVNSTEESKEYSAEALKNILDNMDGYLNNDETACIRMLQASYTAGKAINITQTTAGHAMCYKITSLFECAHGHAAILCDRVLYPWMIENIEKCKDPRGEGYLRTTLDAIGHAMGCKNAEEGAVALKRIFDRMKLAIPCADEKQYEELKNSVNAQRLSNHPIALDIETIDALYHKILR